MLKQETELRYIDAFSGIGGFRIGIENAFKNARPLQQEGARLVSHTDRATSQQHPSDGNKTANQDISRVEGGQISDRDRGHSPNTGGENGGGGQQHSVYPSAYTSSRCVATIEWDKFCCQVLSKQFSETIVPTDIRNINAEQLPDFDLFCGGFPCQSFSIAGRRQGFADERGTMFGEITRILEIKRPKYILLENVKGLLSAPLVDGQSKDIGWTKGYCFAHILQRLGELRYNVQWMVLNSRFFGIPQNRERVFIIGCLGEEPFPEILPFGKPDGENQKKNGEKMSRIAISNASEREFKWNSDVSPAVLGRDYKEPKIVRTELQIRKLTPIECERLQGFPDDFTKEGIDENGNVVPISLTQRYKMCGNAVTTKVIEAIARRWFIKNTMEVKNEFA